MADYTVDELFGKLERADAAGDTEAATVIADEIRRIQGARRSPADFSGVSTGVTSTEAAPQEMQPRGNAVTRALGEIGGRTALRGAAGIYGALGGDAINHYVLDPIDRALFKPEQNLSGLLTGQQPQQRSVLGTGGRTYREAADDLADSLGMRAPQTSGERIASDVGEALTGTGLTLGIGGAVNALTGAGRGAVNRLGQLLTAQPGLQGVSTATGAGASSATREGGGSQGQQLAAGLIGGLAPGVAGATGAATLRGLVRGRDGAGMRRTIQDFGALGATPSVGQASGNRALQGVENILAKAPTSSGVMERFAERQADDIGAGLRQIGGNLSKVADSPAAGRAIQRGIHGPDGFTAKFKATQDALYDRLDEFIPAQTRIDVSNTRQALGELNAQIPGAPNTSRLFQNSRIQGIGNALEQDIAIPSGAQQQLDDALAKIDQLYASRDSAVQDAGRFRAFANDQANRTNQFYPVEGAPRFPGRYSQFPEREAEGMAAAGDALSAAYGNVSRARQIEDTLGQLQAAAAATNGRLPYEAIKKLRTLVGRELQDASLVSDFPRSKFKALYKALSDDLGMAASEAGPDASQAFKRANNYTRMGMDRVEVLDRVIDKHGGPEAVFKAAMSGTKEGASTLRAVMQSIPKDAQRAVTAAVVKRLGLARAGAQNNAGDVFSADTFMTRWNDLSPDAKRVLFDRHGPNFSRDMDTVARVANNIKRGSKVYQNPSGSAHVGAMYTYGAALVGSLFTGGTGLLVAGGLGANGLARVLTSPRAVNWLARTTAMPRGAIPGTINAIRAEGERDSDETLLELAGELEQRVQETAGTDSYQQRQAN